MATPLELKGMLRALEERVSALETEQAKQYAAIKAQVEDSAKQLLDAGTSVEKFVETAEKKIAEKTKRLCPKCNKVPGYFFHVRSCKG